MQDVRIRTGAAVILSLAAFASLPGAAAVLLWWLLLARPRDQIKRLRLILPVLLPVIFFGAVLTLGGGDGISYAIRMVVVVLIGTWLYTTYRAGDFLSLWTWLLGQRTGFELGMMAEMGMQALDLFAADIGRIRMARDLKGQRRGINRMVAEGMILVRGTLRRAEESAELLAIRGFVRGGTYEPVFVTARSDLVAGLAALCMGIIAFIPVSEFFILTR